MRGCGTARLRTQTQRHRIIDWNSAAALHAWEEREMAQ